MKYIVTNAEASEKIRNEQPFSTTRVRHADGSPTGIVRLAGGPARVIVGDHGYLPEEYWTDVETARYVVSSYGTPIGWVRQDGTRVAPDIGYSLTTGQHQMTLRYVWGMKVIPSRNRRVVDIGSTHVRHGRERRLRAGGIDGTGSTLADHADNSADAMHWRA